jgi:transcriptional regulator with XRE-family HTH domain
MEKQKKVSGEWAAIFKAAKVEQRYTYAQISEGTGLPVPSIVSYFLDRRKPKIEAFNKITNFLKIEL